MGRSALFTSLILSLVGWGVVAAPNDATEETVMLRNHLLPGVDYERDPAPAPHLVLVTNSRDGRPPVFQLDTVHMNMAEQFGVLGVIAPGHNQDNGRNAAGQRNPPDNQRDPGNRRNPDGQRNTGSQRNPDGKRNTGSRRNPDGQRNAGSRRNPESRTRTEQGSYRREQTDEMHRYNWWRT